MAADVEADPSLPTEIVGETDGPPPLAGEPAPEDATGPDAATAVTGTAEPAELDDPAEPDDTGDSAGFAEPAELTEMDEPVYLAEPVDEITHGRRGHGLLLAGGFVLAGLAIIGAAVGVVGSLTHGFRKPVEITYKKSAIFSLRAGDCIDPHGQAASVLPCSTAHEAEVFATFTLRDSRWPGDSAVRTAASSGCASRLTGYLNPQLAISLSSTYVYPGSVAWQAGTRTVICEVRATGGQLTGSVRGASATASAG